MPLSLVLRLSLNSSNESLGYEHLQKQFEFNDSAVQKESLNALSQRDRQLTPDCTLVQAEGFSESDCSKPYEVDALPRLQQTVNKVVATAFYSLNQIEEDRIVRKISDHHGQHSSEDANLVENLAADNIPLRNRPLTPDCTLVQAEGFSESDCSKSHEVDALPRLQQTVNEVVANVFDFSHYMDGLNPKLRKALNEWIGQGEIKEKRSGAKHNISCFFNHFIKKELRLDRFDLKSLPDIFGEQRLISRVEILCLEHNKLTSIPPSIGLLEKLTDLRLSNNELRSLPMEICLLKNLRDLDLEENKLTALPMAIGQLHSLRSLKLSSNQLTSLPVAISELQCLEFLIIHHNGFQSIPVEIYQLKLLKSLNFSYNQLTSIAGQISQLECLENLILSGNQLTSLPVEICQLSRLGYLDVANNKLALFPKEIAEVENLQHLDLRRNPLEIPSEHRNNILYYSG